MIFNNLGFVIRLFLVILEVDINRYLLSNSLLLVDIDISYLKILLLIVDFIKDLSSRVISFLTIDEEERLRITNKIKNNDKVLAFDIVDDIKTKSFKDNELLLL